MTVIRVIEPQDAQNSLKDCYERSKINNKGVVPEMHKAISHNPMALSAIMDLELASLYDEMLDHRDAELIAVIVCKELNCQTLLEHHKKELNVYWHDMSAIEYFINNETGEWNPGNILTEKQEAIHKYVSALTNGSHMFTEKMCYILHEAGFIDEQILTINLICSYMNMVCRICIGLGV